MTKGYTIIELLIVMGIFAIFFGFASLNLLGVRSKTSLATTTDVLVSDLRSQQVKSMTGDTGGGPQNINYGIYFTPNSYVLFKGTYSAADPTNFTVNLDEATIATTFAGSLITFNKGSGEVVDFDPNGRTIRLTSTSSGASKVIVINRFGVVTDVN